MGKEDDKTQLTYKFLLESFEKFGEIRSCKISVNPDGTNKGFAYIQYCDKESSDKCLKGYEGLGSVSEYNPPDKTDYDPEKNINQIYFNHVPLDKSEEEIKALFEPFGDVKSFYMKKSDKGQFGNVCYEDKTGKDKMHGPKATTECVEKLNLHEFGPEQKMTVQKYISKDKRNTMKLKSKINS